MTALRSSPTRPRDRFACLAPGFSPALLRHWLRFRPYDERRAVNVPHNGVRTFLPLRLCSGGLPACGGFTPLLLSLSQRSPGSPAIFIIPRTDPIFCVCCEQRLALQSRQMRAREAKDFLVQQTAEQAALESIPLSDLEKRMMYFTEVEECPENPIALNDAFEAEYDTDEYEAKISKLMHHAYQRIKKENPEALRRWKEAIKELSKGDHYILVLCEDGSPLRPTSVSLKFPVLALLVILMSVVLLVVAGFIAGHYGIHLSSEGGRTGRYHAPSGLQTPMPLWLERLLIVLMVGTYLYAILPWALKKPLPQLVSAFSRLFRRGRRGSPRA